MVKSEEVDFHLNMVRNVRIASDGGTRYPTRSVQGTVKRAFLGRRNGRVQLQFKNGGPRQPPIQLAPAN
jgi:hypothetical protein